MLSFLVNVFDSGNVTTLTETLDLCKRHADTPTHRVPTYDLPQPQPPNARFSRFEPMNRRRFPSPPLEDQNAGVRLLWGNIIVAGLGSHWAGVRAGFL